MAVASLSASLQDAISLAQAADFLPRKPHVATVWRWAAHGVHGVKLATWNVGGRRFTTIAAIEAFLQALNSPATMSVVTASLQEAPGVS